MDTQDTTETDSQTQLRNWRITSIVFIVMTILLIIACGYIGYKLYYCKQKPNAVVFIE